MANFSNRPQFIEGEDSGAFYVPASTLIQGATGRSIEAQSARLAHQFLRQNEGLLRKFCSSMTVDYDGNEVYIRLTTNVHVGAIPLLSPTTGRPDIGLIIRPRFEWLGIGAMLAEMGWRVIPEPLRLPQLPGTERRIPPWVMSTIVISRIQAMLERLERRFEMVQDIVSAPRGSVDWQRYAGVQMPRAKFLDIPSRFPDLREDRELKAAIHFALRKQLHSLESQRSAGLFVAQLMALCQHLLEKVSGVQPQQPSQAVFQQWFRGVFSTTVFRQGLEAIEWTVDDRGLVGLSDLRGLPWILSMDEFFEAWLETVVSKVAPIVGGVVTTGRRRETLVPITWEPPYRGSQRYLLPDLVLETENETVIIDAKYKRHWEELQIKEWFQFDDEVRERHRADLLQVIAYSTLKAAKRIVSCLVYPCSLSTWYSLRERNALYFHASIPIPERKVEVVLTAVPMAMSLADAARFFADMIVSIRGRDAS